MNENKKSAEAEDVAVDDIPEAAAENAAEQGASEEQDAAAHAAEQSAGDESVDSLKSRLAAMEAKADDHWARYLRTAAEMENVRKRAQKDVERAHKFGLEKFAGDVLGVRDSLRMGLDAAQGQATVESLIEGSEMTFKLLDQVLTRHGVTEINPVGQAFNPELHEAMAMIDAPDAEPNTVVEVVQSGYELNGRLLRAARVLVAKAPAE